MKATRLTKTLVALITLIVFGMAGMAVADPVEEIQVIGKANVDVKTVKVTFGDLRVDNEQGAAALYRRLQQASRMVCDVTASQYTRLPEITGESKRCYQTALAQAVERLDNGLVTKIHEG